MFPEGTSHVYWDHILLNSNSIKELWWKMDGFDEYGFD